MTNLLIRLFIKDYRNVADAKVRGRYGNLSGLVGIITNLLLFAAKITVGLVFHSIAIVADAVNNLSDSASSVVTLVGFKISGKPADEKHPFGHARMEYIAGLIVSIIILILGWQLAQSSFDKILHPEEVTFSWVTIGVLAGSILVKLWQCLFYKKMGKAISSTTLSATATDSLNDVIATSAILVSMVVSYFVRFNLDGYMGMVVAVVIAITGVRLIMDTVSPLLGVAPPKELVDEIYQRIMSYDGIIGLHDLNVHSYGPSHWFATVHCEVDAKKDIMLSHDIVDNIERDFLDHPGIHLVIHLDPVVTDDEKTNRVKKQVVEVVQSIHPRLSIHDFRVVWGASHSNLIFDVVAPFGIGIPDQDLKKKIDEKVRELDPSYRTVLMIDHNYVPPAGIEH